MKLVHMRRNDRRLILIRSYEVALTYLPILLIYLTVRDRTHGYARMITDVGFACYTLIRSSDILRDWLTVRFALDDTTVRYSEGWIHTRSLHLHWGDVATFHVTRSAAHRLLNCAQITIGVGGGQRREIVLHAVDERTVKELTGMLADKHTCSSALAKSSAGRVAVTSLTDETPLTPTDARRTVLFRARPRDYLMISLTYGQFILVIPLLLSAYIEAAEWLSFVHIDLPQQIAGLTDSVDRGPSLLLALPIALLVAVTFGAGLAWMRYHSFTADLVDGSVTVAWGWPTEQRRRIPSVAVTGVRVDQNPLMRLVGMARLSVVVRQGADGIGSNVVLPVAPLHHIGRLLATAVPAYSWAGRMPPRSVRAFEVGVAAVAVALLGGLQWLWGPRLALLALAVVIVVVAGNRAWVAVEATGDGLLLVRRGVLWTRLYILRVDDIHVAGRRYGALGASLGRAGLSLYFVDRGARVVHGIALPERSVRAAWQILGRH